MTQLKIIYKDISDLEPYANNPRLNEDAVQYVAESIRQFGMKVPVVIDRNNIIVAGHTRIKACQKLGIRDIPCIIADDLTEDQVNAFRLADNKTAEFSDWDYDALGIEMENITMDLEPFGFDANIGEEEITPIEEDDYEEPEDLEPVVKLGEIWRCGDHILMCGDSTDAEQVRKLVESGGGDTRRYDIH